MEYRLQDGQLHRVQTMTTGGTTQTTVMASSVNSFSVVAGATTVTLGLTLIANVKGGGTTTASSSVTITPRN